MRRAARYRAVSLVLLIFGTAMSLSYAAESAQPGRKILALREKALGLREAVEMALGHIDRTGPEIAEWKAKEEEGRLWPELSLRGRQSFENSSLVQSSGGTVLGTGGTIQRSAGEFTLSYNLLQFLESRPRIQEATAEKRASAFRLRSEEAATILRVSEIYLTFLSRQEALEALDTLRREQLRFLRQQEARSRQQLISSIELLRAEGDLISLEREILSLRSELATAELNLRRLTEFEPEQTMVIAFDPRELDLGFVQTGALGGLLALAKEVNPQLQAAEASAESARSGAEATQSLLYPTLFASVTSGFGRDKITGDTNLSSADFRYGVFLTLNVPLFDWGVRQARVTQANLRAASRLRQASRAAEEIKALIESEYWSFLQQGQSQELLERQVRLANDELNQTRIRVTAGVASLGETLTALAKLVRLQKEFFATKAEALTRGIRLALAVGRSPFTPSLPSPAPPVGP